MARLICALGPDAAGTLLTEFIGDATQRLDAAVYEVGPYYAWTFDAAAKRGATVRLLLDRHAEANREATQWFRNEASMVVPRVTHLPVRLHSKMLVADADRLAVGTGNLIERDARRAPGGRLPWGEPEQAVGTREWWLLADGVPTLAADVRRHFRPLWHGASVVGPIWTVTEDLPSEEVVRAPLPLIPPCEIEVSPRQISYHHGGSAIGAKLQGAIAGARQRIDVVVPYVHAAAPRVRPLLEALEAATQRGVAVRLLLGREAEALSDLHTLAEHRFAVRVMDPVRSTVGHAKGAVVDGVAIVGSANWSEAGLSSSVEAALSVADSAAADYFAAAVTHDWQSARDLSGLPLG